MRNIEDRLAGTRKTLSTPMRVGWATVNITVLVTLLGARGATLPQASPVCLALLRKCMLSNLALISFGLTPAICIVAFSKLSPSLLESDPIVVPAV